MRHRRAYAVGKQLQLRREGGRNDISRGRCVGFQNVKAVVILIEAVERVLRQYEPRLLSLITVFFQCVRAAENQRIEFLRGFSEDIHSEGITFGLVLDFSESVDDLVKYIFVISQLSVAVTNRNAELVERVRRARHFLSQLRERTCYRLDVNIYEIGRILHFLQLLRG